MMTSGLEGQQWYVVEVGIAWSRPGRVGGLDDVHLGEELSPVADPGIARTRHQCGSADFGVTLSFRDFVVGGDMSRRLFCDFEGQFFDSGEFDRTGNLHNVTPPHSRFASVAADPGQLPDSYGPTEPEGEVGPSDHERDG